MKNLVAAIMALSWLFFPFVAYAQSEELEAQAPPVEQSLVPEGEFALKLVTALKIGTAENEAEAENILSSVGITPTNGWIANYPVTPDIIGELEEGVIAAADASKLPIGKDEALKAFRNLTAEFGLEAMSESSDEYAQAPSKGYAEHPDSTVVNNYYYEVGPPVVTYYPPPWDYNYLYAWVPYPFWCHDFFFRGFFVLHDFHRVVHVHKKVVVVSNHVTHPISKKVVVIDPVKRTRDSDFRVKRDVSPREWFHSTDARRGASSIFGRSRERMGDSNIPSMRKPKTSLSPKPERRTERQFLNEERRSPPTSNRHEGTPRQSISEPKSKRDRLGTTSPGMSERRFNQPRNIERPNEMRSPRPSAGQARPFSTPDVTRERSLSRPSVDQRDSGFSERAGKSFSAPSRSFGPPSGENKGSFGQLRQGGGSRLPQQRGASGGFSNRGCRGRC